MSYECIHACVHTCMCALNNPITRVSHNALCPADLDQELYQYIDPDNNNNSGSGEGLCAINVP